ncbi:MAG: OmpA family protein [Chitinophagaceae bacterium]|nr:OmpA family protein [Chitinophagaceae bacterium]
MRFSLILVVLLCLATIATAQQDTLIIHFDFNRTFIRPADTVHLDSLTKTTGIASVTLAGHTDHTGSDRYNNKLSLLRAETTRLYLLSKGLPDSLFKSIEGYGSRRPYDPADPASNRRVEIIVIHNSPPPQPPSPPPPPIIPVSPPSGLQEAFSDTARLTGKNIILRNVNFYGNRHTPLPEAYLELQQLLTVMRQHPGLIIQIQGYVCCMRDGIDGRDADNPSEPLSVQRAKFVYDFLIEGGIARSRISYKGFGASNKIYPLERDEDEREANRRVEIKVISF